MLYFVNYVFFFIFSNIFIDTPAKSSFRTIVPLFDFLNATKVVIFSDTWGYFINGSWNGMIGDISRGEADLCGIFLL